MAALVLRNQFFIPRYEADGWAGRLFIDDDLIDQLFAEYI